MADAKTALLEIIEESPFSTTAKKFFTKKVKTEGATPANIGAVTDLLRVIEHSDFTQIALAVDPNNKNVAAAKAKLESDLKAAGDDYTKTIKRLEVQSKRLSMDIQDDLERLEKIVIDSAKAEA